MLMEQRLEAAVRADRKGRRKDKLLTGEIRRLTNQQRREGRVRPRRGEAALETFRDGNCGRRVRGGGFPNEGVMALSYLGGSHCS